MNVLTEFFYKFESCVGNLSVVLEADDTIVADVWLYNCGAAPAFPEWLGAKEMPFANSVEYLKADFRNPAPRSIEQFSVHSANRDGEDFAQIFYDGQLIAELAEGAKPGWSSFVQKDGPLARTLRN